MRSRAGREVSLAGARDHEGDGAGNGARTRDLKLGKLALYQLSYARVGLPTPIRPETSA